MIRLLRLNSSYLLFHHPRSKEIHRIFFVLVLKNRLEQYNRGETQDPLYTHSISSKVPAKRSGSQGMGNVSHSHTSRICTLEFAVKVFFVETYHLTNFSSESSHLRDMVDLHKSFSEEH